MPETSQEEAFVFAEQVRIKIELLQFSIPEIKTTVSIGIAILEKGERPEKIVARADTKLYEAKRSGKNKTIV